MLLCSKRCPLGPAFGGALQAAAADHAVEWAVASADLPSQAELRAPRRKIRRKREQREFRELSFSPSALRRGASSFLRSRRARGGGSGLAGDLDDAARAGASELSAPRSPGSPGSPGSVPLLLSSQRSLLQSREGAKETTPRGATQRVRCFPMLPLPLPLAFPAAGASSALAQHLAAEAAAVQGCRSQGLRLAAKLAGCCSVPSGRAALGSGGWPRPCSWSSNRGKASLSCSASELRSASAASASGLGTCSTF